MSERTPAPWKLQDLDQHHLYESGTGWEVVGANGETVCDSQQYYPHAVSLPDARLIAAAPTLLQSLQEVTFALENHIRKFMSAEDAEIATHQIISGAKAAIALASPQESEAKT